EAGVNPFASVARGNFREWHQPSRHCLVLGKETLNPNQEDAMSNDRQISKAALQTRRHSSTSRHLAGVFLAALLGLALSSCRVTSVMAPKFADADAGKPRGGAGPLPSTGDEKRLIAVERNPVRLIAAERNPLRLIAAERNPERLVAAERNPERLMAAERNPERLIAAERNPERLMATERNPDRLVARETSALR